jgi:regulator of sigma E protease
MSFKTALTAKKIIRLLVFIAITAMVISLITEHFQTFANILLVVVGFGAVVLIHEFGHFVFAKLSGIKVEAFSIGFSPVLLGIKKTADGLQVRILPGFFPPDDEQQVETEGCLCKFSIGKFAKDGDTEYRIGIIPLGGFVKMLGQDDTKPSEQTDDPRSYANKSVGARAAVIVAGVLFNVISAALIFITVFSVGIERIPAVIGGVQPGSPAAKAGLQSGDEVIEVNGKNSCLEFTNIATAAALSGEDESVELKVKKRDGLIKRLNITPELTETMTGKLKLLGIIPPQSLTVAKVKDVNSLYESTGLKSGDRITAANGKEIEHYWQLEQAIGQSLAPQVKITVKRGEQKLEEALSVMGAASVGDVEKGGQLTHIFSMVPRIKITYTSDTLKLTDPNSEIKKGDIILAAGDVELPTYTQLREITSEYKDKSLNLKLLRSGENSKPQTVDVGVVPRKPKGSERVLIGVGIALDMKHPVVAATIEPEDSNLTDLSIPKGSVITEVDGKSVSSFYDILQILKDNPNQRISIDYRLNSETAGSVAVNSAQIDKAVTVESYITQNVPFEPLKKLYKADNPLQAAVMGGKKTVEFVQQAYITLQRALGGLVSPKNFMGPVGIATISYKIVSQKPFITYVYFLGLISAFIAVFNLLPLLPFDGGHLVFLLIEKIKGSPVSGRIQAFAVYAGLVLVGAFFLYVTFNDIIRSFF